MKDIAIEKSTSDNREFRAITLSNKMKCLLVSDPNTSKSSACLNIGVGSALDPPETPGLAHFLEHMLFMGTEDYPSRNAYGQYVVNNGGYCNASTFFTNTNFHFEITNKCFEAALDIFKSFFICPLFDEKCVNDEIHAVNNENERNQQSDSWRFYQLFYNCAQEGSALNRFIIGSTETLTKDDIRDQLIAFYKKWYSANLMCLCVYSNESLDHLEKLVTEKFSKVPNFDVELPNFSSPENFPKKCLKKLLKMETISDCSEVDVIWVLPNYQLDTDFPLNHLQDSLSHLGECEDPETETLANLLRKQGLASDLCFGVYHRLNCFSFVELTVTLTEQGLQEHQKVLRKIFDAVKLLQTQGPFASVFEEHQKRSELNWSFLEKTSALSFTQYYSEILHLYDESDIAHIVKNQVVYDTFATEKIQKAADFLTPENSLIFLLNRKHEGMTSPLICPWYGTKYTIEPIPEDLLQDLENPKICKNLGTPKPNTFFPENLDLAPADPESEKEVKLLLDSDFDRVWFKKDGKFSTRVVQACITLYFPDCQFLGHLPGRVFVELWIQVFYDSIKEFLSMASQAKSSFSWSDAGDALTLNFAAFSETFEHFMCTCLERLRNFSGEGMEESFNTHKENMIKRQKNTFLTDPLSLSFTYFESIIFDQNFTPEQLLAQVEKFSFKEFAKMCPEFAKESFTRCFFFGNLSSDHALDLFKAGKEVLSPSPIAKDARFQRKILKIEQNHDTVLITKAQNSNEKNCAILRYFQGSPQKDLEKLALHKIVHNLLDNPAFDYLRTKLQLGYVAYCINMTYRSTLGLGFEIQSTEYDPEYLCEQIQHFLVIQKQRFQDLSQKEISEAIQGVINNHKENVVNTYDEFSQTNCEHYSWKFEITQILQNMLLKAKSTQEDEPCALETLKQSIINTFTSLFFENPKILTVEVYSHERMPETTNPPLRNLEGVVREVITPNEISKWKNRQVLYPDLNKNGTSIYSDDLTAKTQ